MRNIISIDFFICYILTHSNSNDRRILMSKIRSQNLIAYNQMISLKKNKNLISVALSVKNISKWQESIQIPLVTFENGWKISAHRIIKVNSSKNQFRVILDNDLNKEIKIVTTISTNEKLCPWIHFHTSIIFKTKFRFFRTGPEIKMDLVPKFNYSKDITAIRQPTRHTPPTNEWKSNDMPAATVWNPQSKVQTFIFIDFSHMDWMSPRNIERFSVYECGLHPDGSFGLIHRVPLKSPITIPSDFKMIFDFYVTQEYRERQPTKLEAIESLITKCFTLLPSYVRFPRNDLTWTKFSEECINDLLKEKYCWIDAKSPKYYAYVLDDAELTRREAIGGLNIFETMTLLSLLPPWILYLQLKSNRKQENHVRRTCRTLNDFIDYDTKFLYNNIDNDSINKYKFIAPTKQSIGDSWYFFEPILRFGWLIRLLPLISVNLGFREIFKTMARRAIDFVQQHNYEITAFYDPFTLKPLDEVLNNDPQRTRLLIKARGEDDIIWKRSAKNYACLGIYIYIMVESYYFFHEDLYFEEATKAAHKLINLSPDTMFWEPFELAYAIAGFAELTRITNDDEYLRLAKKLLLNELRMFYWYNDNSFDWKGKRNNLGLPMACVGIRYSALKETVESIYPWSIFFKIAIERGKSHILPKGVLKFFNLIRINSFYFFSNVLPEEFIYPPRRTTPCPFIPFEDLEMLETPPHFSKSQEIIRKGKRTGTLGREIYGAGGVIFLYLMYEALAKSNNHKIMVLNLDLFDFPLMDTFPPKNLNFIIFNPLSVKITCKISFKTIQKKICRIKISSLGETTRNKDILKVSTEKLVKGIRLDLSEEEAMIVEVIPI